MYGCVLSDRPVYPGMPFIILILGEKFPCSDLFQHISLANIWDMQEHERVHLQFTFTVFNGHLCEVPLGIPCPVLIPFFPSLGFDISK